MILSKLLLLVTCCLLPIHLDSFDPYDCSFYFCQPHGSYWWKQHASFCFRCSPDRIYHCARDYDNPEIFKEGCAIEKNCLAGEEPHLSFKRSGQEIKEPDVYCVTCFDNNYYNSVNKSSSTYSECPDKKWNDCSEGTHKILCNDDDSKNERFCRCDARKGYAPINDQSFEMCSYIDYECDKKECPKLPNGKPQQRLLNYTCAPSCEEGYDRLREDSDICEPIPTIKTAIVIKQNSSTKPLLTTTTPVVPVPVEGCKEDCDEYSICKNGTCVCINSCPPVFKPVCGYDSKSEEYMTFSTECDLRKNFCKDRKFHLKHHGKCEKESGIEWVVPIIIACVIAVLVIIIVIYCCIFKMTDLGRKCIYRFCPYPNLDMEWNVEAPQSDRSVVDGNATVEGETHGSHSHMEPYVEVPQNDTSVVDGNVTDEDEPQTRSSRKAPICEQEDTSTPSLRLRRDSQPIVIHKHQYIYQGPVIKTKGKNTQISIGSNKGEMQIKHNMDDAANGEDEPLLSDQDHEDVTKQIVPVEVHDIKSHLHVEQGDNDNKNGDIINYDDVNRGEVFDSVNDENEKIGGHENNETSLKSDKVKDERKIETDKPATKQLSDTGKNEKSTEKILKRGVSESHESLFNIEDVKAQFNNNMDEYKLMIGYALDGSLRYLLENMEPMLIHTCFTERHMFDFIPLRNITEEKNKTDKSREIVRLVRQTGEDNYNKFKKCLRDTKQNGCLRKILEVQNKYLAKINQQSTERHRCDSALSQSDSDIYSTLNSQTLDDDTFISDIPEHTEQPGTNLPEHTEESDTDLLEHSEQSGTDIPEQTEQSGIGIVPILPSQETKSPCKAGPTVVPAPSDSLEDIQQNYQTESKPKVNLSEVEEMCMKDLKEFVTIKMVDYDRKAITENFEIFVEKCDEIKKKRPELTAETLLPPQLVKSLPESIQYENTPQGFQAYRSSGDDNSCLYQSVSLLLSGTENLQCSLRLMATLHAVSSFEMYKKQLLCGTGNWDAEHWKVFFRDYMNDQMIREIQKLEDAETIIDSCLKVLLMETACLGIKSSVLHVGFLCGAIGINIQQYFQYNTQYGYTSEVVPWIKHLLGESIDVTRPDLHIFWVNHAGIVNGILNHIVPLLKIPEDTS